MGVIVSARKSRRGTGFQIAFGFVIAFIYILFVMLSRSFAEKGGMDPMLAAWFPNMLFTLITVGMYFTVQK